jgi:hypothetical protein
MNSGIACTVCGEQGHKPSKCKSIGIPPDGFYSGGGGGHQHDDDCEDHIHSSAHWIVAQNGSQDDEVPSNSQAPLVWDLYSPNRPSNEAVQEVPTQVV